jgi:hypothetical protein
MDYEIKSDKLVVWVNVENELIGRFSKFGIDIHTTVEDQFSGKGECLDCTHSFTGMSEWHRFQNGMKRFYNVIVSDEHMPEFLKKEISNCKR